MPDNTDEGEDVNYKRGDFWLFEYKDDGKIAGSPRFFEVGAEDDLGKIPVPGIMPPSGKKYKCIIIANTHDENFTSTLTDFSTYSAFQKEFEVIRQYTDMCQVNGSTHDLLMNGHVDVTATSREINCVLYRNVAKLSLTLTNAASSGITLNSIQIRNVSDHLFYFDQGYSGNAVPCPTNEQSGFTDLPKINITAGNSGSSHEYTFYLPRNMRGTNLSLDKEGKNINAPENATYVEILATDTEANAPLRYRFYLGKNISVVGNWMYSWWKSDKSHWYWRIYGGDLAVRYWFGKASKEKPLQGHHAGLYGQIITYDFEIGNKGILADRWSWSAGLEYGYSLPIAQRLNIDFTIGAGYHTGQFYEYLPIDGHYVWQATKHRRYIGPTKAEISLVWLIGRGNENPGKGGKK